VCGGCRAQETTTARMCVCVDRVLWCRTVWSLSLQMPPCIAMCYRRVWPPPVLPSAAELSQGVGGWVQCSGAAPDDHERAGGAPTVCHPGRVAKCCV
jgi:hypothetical protein